MCEDHLHSGQHVMCMPHKYCQFNHLKRLVRCIDLCMPCPHDLRTGSTGREGPDTWPWSYLRRLCKTSLSAIQSGLSSLVQLSGIAHVAIQLPDLSLQPAQLAPGISAPLSQSLPRHCQGLEPVSKGGKAFVLQQHTCLRRHQQYTMKRVCVMSR